MLKQLCSLKKSYLFVFIFFLSKWYRKVFVTFLTGYLFNVKLKSLTMGFPALSTKILSDLGNSENKGLH